MRVVGCFLEHKGKFVILLRHRHKPDGNTWGLPSGKVEFGEKDVDAVLRELKEETGYAAVPSELEHLGDFAFIASSGQPYTYVTYRVALNDQHKVKLEEGAHLEYRWVTAEECYTRQDLISGFHKLLRMTGYIE